MSKSFECSNNIAQQYMLYHYNTYFSRSCFINDEDVKFYLSVKRISHLFSYRLLVQFPIHVCYQELFLSCLSDDESDILIKDFDFHNFFEKFTRRLSHTSVFELISLLCNNYKHPELETFYNASLDLLSGIATSCSEGPLHVLPNTLPALTVVEKLQPLRCLRYTPVEEVISTHINKNINMVD